jgi:hypothetical protein
MTTQRSRRAFTLRFENAKTHTLLALVSSHLGVSMNELAEKMIEAELEVASLALQEDLAHTLDLLASYQEDPEADIARVAHAEVAYPDPVRARLAGSPGDPLGIGRVFASAANAD